MEGKEVNKYNILLMERGIGHLNITSDFLSVIFAVVELGCASSVGHFSNTPLFSLATTCLTDLGAATSTLKTFPRTRPRWMWLEQWRGLASSCRCCSLRAHSTKWCTWTGSKHLPSHSCIRTTHIAGFSLMGWGGSMTGIARTPPDRLGIMSHSGSTVHHHL